MFSQGGGDLPPASMPGKVGSRSAENSRYSLAGDGASLEFAFPSPDARRLRRSLARRAYHSASGGTSHPGVSCLGCLDLLSWR